MIGQKGLGESKQTWHWRAVPGAGGGGGPGGGVQGGQIC